MMTDRDKISEDFIYYHKKIKEWPEDERPREKLLKRNPASLSDAELLAILFRTGAGKITAVDLAKSILSNYKSLNSLASVSVPELKKFKGIGTTKAITLIAAFEIGRRAAAQGNTKKLRILSPKDVYERFAPFLRDLKQEVFKVLLLNSSNYLLRDIEISRGTLNASLVHPREVFRAAIIEPAASIILLHNHPSGNPEPSQEDIQITKQLIKASKVVEITIHDHIIIGSHNYVSFAERGILSEN